MSQQYRYAQREIDEDNSDLSPRRHDRTHLERLLLENPKDRHGLTVSGSGQVVKFATHEDTVIWQIKGAAYVSYLISSSVAPVFMADRDIRSRVGLTFRCGKLGWRILARLRDDFSLIEEILPSHSFNPFFEIFRKARAAFPSMVVALEAWDGLTNNYLAALVNDLNAFVENVRSRSREAQFIQNLEKVRRRCASNQQSGAYYINALFEHKGSRQLVIRQDFSWRHQLEIDPASWHRLDLKTVKTHMAKLMRYIRSHYPYTGHILGLEYGALTGYHFHALFFLNGHVAREGISYACMFEKDWERITEGRGVAYNCNMKVEWKDALGLVDYHQHDRRNILVNKVLGYVTKADFLIRYDGIERTYFRGKMPLAANRGRSGRPRKHSQVTATGAKKEVTGEANSPVTLRCSLLETCATASGSCVQPQ
ncbi:MAG: hypothetical protein V4757_02045 [Pseudomonadota bacterium]